MIAIKTGKLGSLKLIATASPIAASSVEFINCFSDAYDMYLLEAQIQGSVDFQLRGLLSNDSGLTWDTTANYRYITNDVAYFAFDHVVDRNGDSNTWHALTAHFMGVRETGYTVVRGGYLGPNAADGTVTDTEIRMQKREAGPWDSLQIYPSTGTITGELIMYGYRGA